MASKKGILLLLTSIIIVSCGTNQQQELTNLQPFHLNDVKLLDGPFYQGQQADLDYILALSPDRLLAPYLKDAGIEPLDENYPNWENSGLDGHIGGHYLSALALMYAAIENEELQKRLDYMLDWLEKCQVKNGNGYVGGIPNAKQMWDNISQGNIDAGNFSLNQHWVPLYNIHKLFAGLNDVYTITGNEKALNILIKLTDWFQNTTSGLSDEQVQDMLQSEHGGLNEVFVEVYRHTGDKKYLNMAKRFSHRAILNPLLKNENELTGLHANTQIPKVIGYKQYADAADSASWSEASDYFWNTVVNEWTISIGGNSVREHFHPADDFTSMIESNQGPETCNTYNMLRLTKLLFLSDPKAKYLDYYERALFNHILSSEHRTKGGFVYFTPMRPRHYRVYSQPQTSFWCCVGSGLENPGRYGEMIYAHDEENIYVNMFMASEVSWDQKSLVLTQHTDFPYQEKSKISIQLDSPQTFGLNIRKPGWVKDGTFEVNVNEQKQKTDGQPYININREWQTGDVIEVSFSMATQAEYLPDNSPWVSFVHGPIVLAAISDSTNLKGLWADASRMGHVASGEYYPIAKTPMLVTEKSSLSEVLEPVPNQPLHFTFSETVYAPENESLVLKPFFDIHEARYIIYWPVVDSLGLAKKLEVMKDREEAILAQEGKTVDKVATGEQQPESDHFFKGEHTASGYFKDQYWRNTRAWFSYQLNNPNNAANTLNLTFYGEDKGSEMAISINDISIDTLSLDGAKGETFFYVSYPLEKKVLQSSKNGILILKFKAVGEEYTPRIFDVRLLKENN